MIHYSPSRGGFFHAVLHGADVPNDAVKISAAKHAMLLAGQAAGQRIAAGRRGFPVLVDPPAPSAERLWALLRRRRDGLLATSDWSQLPDAPSALQAAWRPYRQALRDLPASTRDPAKVSWPEPPAP